MFQMGPRIGFRRRYKNMVCFQDKICIRANNEYELKMKTNCIL